MSEQEALTAIIVKHLEWLEKGKQIQALQHQQNDLEKERHHLYTDLTRTKQALVSPRFPHGTAQVVQYNGAEFVIARIGATIEVLRTVLQGEEEPADPFEEIDDDSDLVADLPPAK